MWTNFRSWLSDLPLRDPLVRRQAGTFQVMQLILIGTGLLGLLIDRLTAGGSDPSIISLIVYSLLLASAAGALALLRHGHFTPAVILSVVGLILVLGIAIIASGLSNSSDILIAFAVPITLAGLITGRRGLLIAAGSSIGIVAMAGVLQAFAPALANSTSSTPPSVASILPGFIVSISVLSLFLDRFGASLREALTAAREREQELEGLRGSLETTVAERTASLQQALRDVEQREARLATALDELSASQIAVRELSAPVIPVLPGVVIAPLIGSLDSSRASLLADNVLGMVERERARQVIFDITGVSVVDTHVAQVLLQTAAAVRLLGARPLLVGIRPEVAQTIISLGLDFAAIATYPNLQEAVEALLPGSIGHGLNSAERAN